MRRPGPPPRTALIASGLLFRLLHMEDAVVLASAAKSGIALGTVRSSAAGHHVVHRADGHIGEQAAMVRGQRVVVPAKVVPLPPAVGVRRMMRQEATVASSFAQRVAHQENVPPPEVGWDELGGEELPLSEETNEDAVQTSLEHVEEVAPEVRGANLPAKEGYTTGMMFVNGQATSMKHENKCLSTNAGGKDLVIEDCYRGDRSTTPDRQKWYWSGRRIRNREFDNCITFPWFENTKVHVPKRTTILEVKPCTESTEQKWYFDDFQRLKNEFEGSECMDTLDGETQLFMHLCDSRHSQWWAYF